MNKIEKKLKSSVFSGVEDLDGINGVRILERYGDTKYYSVYFHGEIEEIKYYSGLLHLLEMGRPQDHFTFRINSPGGFVHSMQSLIPAMKECESHITTVAEGEVMSAATALFFAGDSYVVKPYSLFMFHDGSSCSHGKLNETKMWTDAQLELLNIMHKQIIQPYLSEEEIDAFQSGIDLYLKAEDIVKRIKKHTPKKLVS